jgi:3-methyladenine DNA glycosylase AlkD
MARFGIKDENVLGISIEPLRKIARDIGKDHKVAIELWDSGIHEARILACMVDEHAKVTTSQMDKWMEESGSWDIVDGCCLSLFIYTPFAYAKVVEWSARPEEFVKRAAFTLIACLAVHDKKADDATFLAFLPIIERESIDERNFVRKAVNWALRQIGKRNLALNAAAIATAREVAAIPSKSAHWIAADAIRELTSEAVQKRLREKETSKR